ncbi:mpv17-like protein isoform X2 [Panulirus ornatus]|uniref:mpv17-like protein isoform X2 n=1 Tax=Panulirus ornatus TaxID=150431 RepID=UPI003A85B8BB
MLSRIRRYLKSKPLLKNMVAYGSLFVGAEWTQQTTRKRIWKDDKDPTYDMGAFARYTFFGVLWYPVIYHRWYSWLDSRFMGTSLAVVTKKSLIDQFVMEPPLLASFYIGMSILEGKEDIFAECKKKYIPTFLSGCIFWLPAMALNFWLMPNSMRIFWANSCE